MPESQQNRHSTDIGPKLTEIPIAIKPLDLSAKTEVIVDAAQDIKNTLSPMHGPAEHTNVTSIPEIGALVKLYNKGVEFPAKVARIEKTAKGVQIIVEAGPEFPDPKFADGAKREYPMSPSEFAGLFGPKNTKDTAVPVAPNESPESKYDTVLDTIDQVVLQETLSKFAGREIPQAIIDAQLGIVAYDLAEAGFPEKYVDVAKTIIADFKEHNAPFQAAKASAAVVDGTNEKKVPEWQQTIIDHPDLEKSVAELDQKVQKLINSQEFIQAQPINGQTQLYSADSSIYTYPRVLTEARGLPGMTPQIFEALQRKWDKEVGRTAELATPLTKLASLIASYQAKTETKILDSQQKNIVDAIRDVPNLSKAQRDILLAQAGKQIREHNDSVNSIQAARTALETALKGANPVDAAHFLATIDQISNLSAEEKTALKADFSTQINTHNQKADDTPELDMSGTTDITMNGPEPKSDTLVVNDHELEDVPLKDPNFDQLIDSVDEFAQKLQTDLGRQKSNRGEIIDLKDLHNQLVNALVDAGLSPVSVQAKEWLATKEETARQINTEVQELNRIEALVNECQNTIDDDLVSAGETTPVEISALQEKIDSLPDGDAKTELQGRVLELHEHNKGLAAADELLRVALARDTAIDESILNQAIGNVLPKAVDNYWLAAIDLVHEHNAQLSDDNIPTEDSAIAVSEEEEAIDQTVEGIKLTVDQLAGEVLDEQARNEKLHTALESLDHDARLERKRLFAEGKDTELNALAKRACEKLGIDIDTEFRDIRTWHGENDVIVKGYACDKEGNIVVQVNVFESGSTVNVGQDEIDLTTILEKKLTEKTSLERRIKLKEASATRSSEMAKQLDSLDITGREARMKDAVDKLVADAWPVGEVAPDRTLGKNQFLELMSAIDQSSFPDEEKTRLMKSTKRVFDAEQKRLKEAFDGYHAAEALAQTPAANTQNATIITPLTADVLSTAPITTVNTSQVAPAVNVTSDPVATPAATVVDVPLPEPTVLASPNLDTSTTIDTTQVAPTVAVTPDPIAAPSAQADVLSVAPVVTPVDVPAADVPVAPKAEGLTVPAIEMTPEQKLSLEKNRDQIVDLVEKSLILSEAEKARLVVKAVELLRTADKNTNVLAELQKLMVASERHQSIQNALLNSEKIADQIQTAVVDALDTNSLDHKASDAAFKEVLASLPTDQARATLQEIYDQAIGDKKLRGNPDKIKALVEKALADLADQNSSRTESLKPLFNKINAQVQAHIRQGETQVLGSQTIEPSLADWEKPVPTEAELAAEKMSRTQKLRKKLGGLVDRIRGKSADTTTEESSDDETSEGLDTPKSQADIVAGMVDSNPDLTANEKTKLKAKVLELLEKGTDVNKTLEQLRLTLSNRDQINKEISALVLNASELSKQMYFTLSAALQTDLSEEKRREAFLTWQAAVDKLPTSRAKLVLKQVYQAAIKNPKISTNVDKLEEMIANSLAETGMVDARRDAVLNLVDTLSTEINKAITARKSPDDSKQAEVLADQPKAAEVVAQVVTDQPKAPEVVAQAPQVSDVLAAQPKDQVETNNAAEKQRQFLVGIENLIASAKKIGVELDQDILHMYALKSDKLDKALLGDTLARIDQLLAGKKLDLSVAQVNVVAGSVPEKNDSAVENVDLKLNDQLHSAINTLNLQAQTADRDVSPREFFASDMDQVLKVFDNVNDPDLQSELRSIRNYLVGVADDQDIGNEPLTRLEKVLAKYPEVFATISGFVSSHIKDHNNRKAMASEIAQREKVMMDNIRTATPESIRTEIKTLEKEFGATINRHGVDIALAHMNDKLREAQHKEAATKEIAEMWDNDLTLNLDKISQILANHQLDRTILDKVTDFAKAAGKIQNKATSENRDLSDNDRSQVLFNLIPNMSNVPTALKLALAAKMTRMFGDYNKRRAATQRPQALAS